MEKLRSTRFTDKALQVALQGALVALQDLAIIILAALPCLHPLTCSHRPCQEIYLGLQAADWRAQGDLNATMRALKLIVTKDPQSARAWFALGQTLMTMKVTEEAHKAYKQATLLETEPQVLARAFLGAGISSVNHLFSC